MGSRSSTERSSFEGDEVGIFPHAAEHRYFQVALTSGFPHMLSTSVQSSVTLNFQNEKSPMQCSLSLKFFDHLLFALVLVLLVQSRVT